MKLILVTLRYFWTVWNVEDKKLGAAKETDSVGVKNTPNDFRLSLETFCPLVGQLLLLVLATYSIT